MKLRKNLYLFILFIGYLFSFDLTKANFFEFAYISGTDYLNFKGQVDGNNYEVKINTGNVEYITGNDNLVYQCFKLYGTGYTKSLGEVFFSYSGFDSYTCIDGKLRGYAKINAGGWIEFEDKDLGDGENFGVFSNHFQSEQDTGFYYHSKDGNGNGDSFAFSDGVGLWNFNKVKSDIQTRKEMFDFIEVQESEIYIQPGKIANGKNPAKLLLKLKDKDGKNINSFFAQKIGFEKYQDNIFWHNEESGIFFTGFANQIENKLLSGGSNIFVYSILSFSGIFEMFIEYDEKKIHLKGNTYFDSPLSGSFVLTDGNGDGKILIGDTEKGKLNIINTELANITDISYDIPPAQIQFLGTGIYEASAGQYGNLNNTEFNINFLPKTNFVDNVVLVYYKITGKYNIDLGTKQFGNLPFEVRTNIQNFYPDKKIYGFNYQKTDCNLPKGNGNDLCKIKVILKNNKNYSIPFLSGKINIDDINKNIGLEQKYKSFDINELNGDYNTGLFLYGNNNFLTNNEGIFEFGFYSYKPVVNGQVKLELKNITGFNDIYNWSQSNFSGNILQINFDKIVNIYFSGINIGNGIVVNENNQTNISYERLDSNVETRNASYNLSGSIWGCSNCYFISGGILTGNEFGTKDITIYVSGSNDPDLISYYNTQYSYKLNGLQGQKIIILKPNIYLQGKMLNILGQFLGLQLFGLANRAFNFLAMLQAVGNIAVIGSNFSFSNYINNIKSETYINSRGTKIDEKFNDFTIDEINGGIKKIYKCNDNNAIINLNSNLIIDENELVFLNCQIHIKSDLKLNNEKSSLKIISLMENQKNINYNINNGWQLKSNIYIYPNVKTIFASLITDGSIFFLTDNNVNSENIFVENRLNNDDLKNQIYIKGQLISRNILGGGFVNDGQVILPGGIKKSENENIFGKPAYVIAQGYDINFWRATYVINNTFYNTGDLSDFILEKYGCSGNVEQDRQNGNYICFKPVVLEK